MKIAFIGLGVIGAPIAGHLATAGHELKVYNRTRAKAMAWVATHGGSAAATPRAAAEGAELVFTCVNNDDDVRAVSLGDKGVFAGMQAGAVLVDHTTASAKVAVELEAAASKLKLAFLDAPLSGGQSGAEQGTLTVMVGGDAATFKKAKPVIAHYARNVTRMGDCGAGQKTKMVNQICITGVLQGLSEGLVFAQRVGLDATQVLDVISKGAASSWQMENRGKTMIDDKFDFGYAVDLMRKDLSIVFAEARTNKVDLPVAALVDRFCARLQRAGHGKLVTSSLIKLLKGANHG